MLVADVADDLLQNVLERDETHHLAIFVDDEGEMGLALQEGLELILERRRLRHEPGLSMISSILRLRGVAARRVERAQEVLGVQHADEIIRALAPQRHARVGRGEHLA